MPPAHQAVFLWVKWRRRRPTGPCLWFCPVLLRWALKNRKAYKEKRVRALLKKQPATGAPVAGVFQEKNQVGAKRKDALCPTKKENIITNTHTPEKTEVTVIKLWEDNNNQDGLRPRAINISLLGNGTIKESVNLTAISGWTHTFTNLDKKANGVDINYTVVENNVPTGYTSVISGDMNSVFKITNTHQIEKTSVKVNKEWNDANNQDGIRMESISVSLMNGTTVVDTQDLSAANNWEYIFTDLDKKANGEENERFKEYIELYERIDAAGTERH